MASFSINASSLRRSPAAPAAPVPTPEAEEARSAAALRRTFSGSAAKTMSVDGGGEGDDASGAATASTSESGR